MKQPARPTIQLCFALLLCFALASHVAAQRPMQPADILRVATPAEAQISPDGTRVAYTLTTVEGKENRTTIYLAATSARANSRPAPLLPTGWTASAPRWSPDGKRLAFLSAHDGRDGIWVVNLDDATRTPRFIAPIYTTNFHIAYAGESLAWSPDSRRLAYISTDVPEPMTAADANAPRVITRLQYKSRTAFSDNRRTHVFVTDIERPAPRKLTDGDYYDHALTWNPDGREIAFLSNREADPEAINNSDIFAVNTDGDVRRITDTKGCEYEPAWSPDGSLIAYTATKRPVTTIDSIAEDAHIWVITPDGKSAGRELTAKQDRRTRLPRWSSDSRTIFFLAGDTGRTLIYTISTVNDEVKQFHLNAFRRADALTGKVVPFVHHEVQISGFSLVSQSKSTYRLAFTSTDVNSPTEAWVNLNYGASERISAHNDALVRSLTLAEPEEVNFKSFDNTPVQGWLMKPANFDASKKYPLILSVHGGPHGMYGYSFNSTFQAYNAAGYAVLFLNPRGSSGYGQAFSDGTLGQWGGGDYKDLMAGVDFALGKYSWLDRDRLGVTGGSYGGFMTNWIVTQTPRFRAAVSHASVSNLISFYSTSLYQDLIHAEFAGFPWDNYETLWQWSPIRYVKQVETPVMFTHGELDNDVHITQAEEMYTALRRRGIEAALVRYPGEGHGLRRPANRVDHLMRSLAWFDKHLKN